MQNFGVLSAENEAVKDGVVADEDEQKSSFVITQQLPSKNFD